MLAQQRLDLINVKIERAKEHLDNLRAEVPSYISSGPYVIDTRLDPETVKLIYFVKNVQPIPYKVSTILGDIIQNLRSALDHLAYQLVWIGTGEEPSSHVCFPIADDNLKYIKKSQKDLKGARAPAIAAVDELNPYKGGNDLLWQLHKLNNIDKHRILITAGSAFRSVNVAHILRGLIKEHTDSHALPSLSEISVPDIFLRPIDRKFPLKQGDKLYIDNTPDASSGEQPQFRFDVAFGEEGVIYDEPIIDTLESMVGLVEDILLTFEDHLE